jgi:hypothetical protein
VSDRHRHAALACAFNAPPIEVNQVWCGYDGDGVLLRRVRILAPYPDPIPAPSTNRAWIYMDLPGGRLNRLSLNELRVCPEFNLRYVFKLEGMYEATK